MYDVLKALSRDDAPRRFCAAAKRCVCPFLSFPISLAFMPTIHRTATITTTLQITRTLATSQGLHDIIDGITQMDEMPTCQPFLLPL
jgi:hypothetical protein